MNSTVTETSLQDAFKVFLTQRRRQIKRKEILKHKQQGSSIRAKQLREMFIGRLRHYIGTPYSAKYHPDPQDPFHSSNCDLYLDCCGIIRQALTDLAEDFGFQIGKWNQAYQFDTLPIEIAHEDMKPGDLIFYSGRYTKPNMKRQKHDMVHVEVHLEGEKTIASRWGNGTVSVFDSYKFQAKNWELISHHFRSIDTWLNGICRSFCPEHDWVPKDGWYSNSIPTKKSIFYSNEECTEDESIEAEAEM